MDAPLPDNRSVVKALMSKLISTVWQMFPISIPHGYIGGLFPTEFETLNPEVIHYGPFFRYHAFTHSLTDLKVMDGPLHVNQRLGGGSHIQAYIHNIANVINMYYLKVHRGSMPHFETLTPGHPLRTFFSDIMLLSTHFRVS